jgi:uncharacterized protein YuzE
MQWTYDQNADALYVRLTDATCSWTDEVATGSIAVDYDENDEMIGVEVLGVVRGKALLRVSELPAGELQGFVFAVVARLRGQLAETGAATAVSAPDQEWLDGASTSATVTGPRQATHV